MAWRKCVVRTLVFSIVAALSAAAFLYQRWTSPAAIREQLIARIQELLPGVTVSVGSAHLSLLGHIDVYDVRLSRRDDPDRVDFAQFRSAKIFHDKEQLLDGKLVIRKIELERPLLRVMRGPEGRWNITSDLFSKPRPELSLPAIVIKNGTVSLEDFLASPSRPAILIKGIKAVMVNDPLTEVKFSLTGKSDLAGDVRISDGIWARSSNALALKLDAPAIPIKPPLIHSLAAYLHKLTEHAHRLEGTARVHAEIGYQPASTQPWTQIMSCQLTGGKLEHPRIPLPVDQIEAKVTFVDGELRLDNLTARLGNSPVYLTGRARLDEAQAVPPSRAAALESLTPEPAALVPEHADFEGDLRIEQLTLTPELFAGLPDILQELNQKYAPRGLVDLNFHFSRQQGEWVRKCHIKALDVSATFYKFLYTLEHVEGNFDHVTDTRRRRQHLHVDLRGLAGTRPVNIVGDVDGDGKDSAVHIDISGLDIVMDEKLKNALRIPPDPDQPGPHEEPKLYKLACEFHPTGKVDFQAFIRREAYARAFKNRYLLKFHDATVQYEVFSYPLEDVSGILDVGPDWWEARDFVGSHHGGSFRVRGRSDPLPPVLGAKPDPQHLFFPWWPKTTSRFWVEIVGNNAALDQDMDAALAARPENAELAKTWKVFQPRGTIDFVAFVERFENLPPEVDVSAQARGCSIRPDFFRYELSDLSGKFRYVQRQVIADEIRARHGPTSFSLDRAQAHLKVQGGAYVQMMHLRGSNVVLDRDLLQALPDKLCAICVPLQLKDPFNLAIARFDVDTNAGKNGFPHIYWDGKIDLHRATLQAGLPIENVSGEAACRGQFSDQQLQALNGNLHFKTASILRQPFQEIRAHFAIPANTAAVVAFDNLNAHVFGGQVYGTAALEFGPNTHYELNLGAANIQLEEFGKANLGSNAPLSGLVYGELFLKGQGSDIQNLNGHGKIDVPSGRLYNLPAFLGLLKIFDLRMPNNVFFDEAHARYTIQGAKVTVNQLDFLGNPFSLRGQGDMSLYGTDIRLDFYAVGARVLEYLPPVIKEFPRMLSENLWRIKVRGKLGDLKIIQEPMPVVVDPARNFLDALAGKRNPRTGIREQEPESRNREPGPFRRRVPLLPDR